MFRSPKIHFLISQRKKWTTEEEESIVSGVEKFGIGRWAEIRDEYKNVFQNRSSVDIKDKYRNLQKKTRT